MDEISDAEEKVLWFYDTRVPKYNMYFYYLFAFLDVFFIAFFFLSFYFSILIALFSMVLIIPMIKWLAKILINDKIYQITDKKVKIVHPRICVHELEIKNIERINVELFDINFVGQWGNTITFKQVKNPFLLRELVKKYI